MILKINSYSLSTIGLFYWQQLAGLRESNFFLAPRQWNNECFTAYPKPIREMPAPSYQFLAFGRVAKQQVGPHFWPKKGETEWCSLSGQIENRPRWKRQPNLQIRFRLLRHKGNSLRPENFPARQRKSRMRDGRKSGKMVTALLWPHFDSLRFASRLSASSNAFSDSDFSSRSALPTARRAPLAKKY